MSWNNYASERGPYARKATCRSCEQELYADHFVDGWGDSRCFKCDWAWAKANPEAAEERRKRDLAELEAEKDRMRAIAKRMATGTLDVGPTWQEYIKERRATFERKEREFLERYHRKYPEAKERLAEMKRQYLEAKANRKKVIE